MILNKLRTHVSGKTSFKLSIIFIIKLYDILFDKFNNYYSVIGGSYVAGEDWRVNTDSIHKKVSDSSHAKSTEARVLNLARREIESTKCYDPHPPTSDRNHPRSPRIDPGIKSGRIYKKSNCTDGCTWAYGLSPPVVLTGSRGRKLYEANYECRSLPGYLICRLLSLNILRIGLAEDPDFQSRNIRLFVCSLSYTFLHD